jgi:signal transduction histidine kinase
VDRREPKSENYRPMPNSKGQKPSLLSRYRQLDAGAIDDDLFIRKAKLASTVSGKPVACIYLRDDEGEQLKAWHGIEAEKIPELSEILDVVMEQKDIIELSAASTGQAGLNESGYGYVAGITLQNGTEESFGALVLMGKGETHNTLTNSQKEVIRTITGDLVRTFKLSIEKREMEKRHAEKDELIRIVSHDMRNPLVGIIGFSELMKEEAHNDEHRRMLEYIESAGNSMLDVVSVLLNSEYIRNEAFIIKRKQLDAAELTRDVIDLHRPLALLKNIELNVEMADQEVCSLDPEKWKQIVSNLLSNAVKFSAPGGRVDLSLNSYTNRRKHLTLRVSDEGIGMTSTMVDNLFTGKESIRRIGTEGEQSTGFGMYIVNKFVALMKGSLNVTSEPGEGTTVEIDLPV